MEQRRSRRFHLHFFHTIQSLLNFPRITIHRVGNPSLASPTTRSTNSRITNPLNTIVKYLETLPVKIGRARRTRADPISSNNRARVEKSEAVYDKGCTGLEWHGDAVATEVFGE